MKVLLSPPPKKRGGGGGEESGIPTGFDISPLNFGQFFHPGATTSIQTAHTAVKFGKIYQNNSIKKKLILLSSKVRDFNVTCNFKVIR